MKVIEKFPFKYLNFSFFIGLVFVLGGWMWAWISLGSVELPVIIHFSDISGINQVGYAGDLAKVGAFGVIVVFINFLISTELERRDKFLGKLAAFVTVFMSILIFIYFAAIISVN